MNKFTQAFSITAGVLSAFSLPVFAEEEVQDMSDPLAVFTQVGAGATNKGLNLKIGKTYDTGSDVTMGMNVFEVKGFGGELLGWDSNQVRDDSVDSFRFRNFNVNMTNGRGAQVDVSYDIASERADASYSFIQALPKFGPVQFFPLAGAGVTIQNNAVTARNDQGEVTDRVEGYTMPGTFALIGTYTKITLTDKIWLNYNPMFMTTLSGSDDYKSNAFGGKGDMLVHEFAASYQFTPRFNVRYFANWNEDVDFGEGDHRIEFNYQL